MSEPPPSRRGRTTANQDKGKRQLWLGWDVGGWHCDGGGSQDALVLLALESDRLEVVGKSPRGNFMPLLLQYRGSTLIRHLLSNCGFDAPAIFDLAIAIDTPLGWPEAFHSLLRGESVASSTAFRDANNPYTRRKSEIDIIGAKVLRVNRTGQRHSSAIVTPLSPVRDMIGSQATKGIHFLQASGQRAVESGVFAADHDGISISTIEAYPSLARAVGNSVFDEIFCSLKQDGEHEDLSDALQCAIVAHLFSDRADEIAVPLSDYSLLEGRIFYPKPES